MSLKCRLRYGTLSHRAVISLQTKVLRFITEHLTTRTIEHTFFRPKLKWTDRSLDDLIIFDKKEDIEELTKSYEEVGNKVLTRYKSTLTRLIIKYWDYFCVKGARRKILDYEFIINTGASLPIYFCHPSYGPHKKLIIIEQVTSILASDQIEECGGAWGNHDCTCC